jgi:hypothetical protein
MEVNGQPHAPAALPQGKSPWYLLGRSLGGPQNRSRRGGETRNSQPVPGLEPPIIQPVAQRCTSELSGLLKLITIIDKILAKYFNGQLERIQVKKEEQRK